MSNNVTNNILAIDTSSKNLILGLSFGGDRIVKSEETVEQSHGQMIIKKIGELFGSADLKKEELDTIVVCTGPGSFTGLRIGLSAAKGLATALNLKVIAVNLFEIAAHRLRHINFDISVLVPLKKDEFFIMPVGNEQFAIDNIKIISDNNLKEIVDQPLAAYHFSLSDYFDMGKKDDFSDQIRYDASDLIYLCEQKLAEGKIENIAALEPLYIQKSQAEINYDLHHKK